MSSVRALLELCYMKKKNLIKHFEVLRRGARAYCFLWRITFMRETNGPPPSSPKS